MLPRLLRARSLAAGLLGLVLLLDAALTALPWSPVTAGPLDEPAHLATALLALLAAAGARQLLAHPVLLGSALLGSVVLDVDHVPLYAGVPHVADGGRPYSHCLLTVALLLLAAAVGGRHRPVLGGLALGVGLHLVRDVATGPGLQPWVPLSSSTVRLPHVAYALLLAGLAAAATLRAQHERVRTARPGPVSGMLAL